MQNVLFRDLGNLDYLSAWNYQEELLQKNVQVKTIINKELLTAEADRPFVAAPDRPSTNNYFLLLEHPPVYTLGKSGKMEHILITAEEMNKRKIDFFKTNRGGDITFHGPGQLVGYPILDLEKFYKDIGRYLRELEEVVIRTIAEYGLIGERSPGETGVWLEPSVLANARKICAMGVRCSRWITMHGFALNVKTDLEYFNNIVPCGIQNKQVTSMQKEVSRPIEMEDVKQKIKRNFQEVFNVSLETF